MAPCHHNFVFFLCFIVAGGLTAAFESALPRAGSGPFLHTHLRILRAVARLQSPDGAVRGLIEFTQPFQAGSATQINGTFQNLPEEDEFGLKILEYGNMTSGCFSMGKEFNPDGVKLRADAHNPNHWVGTLGNVKNGKYENEHNHKVALFGRNSVIGRGIVLFENPDDGGEFSTRDSQLNGNVGKPVACGIIGRLGGAF